MTAALYTAREGIDTLVIEKAAMGGQAAATQWLDNVPGFATGIEGATFSDQLFRQTERFGVEFLRLKDDRFFGEAILHAVERCWSAYERFVLCATIALGLLQLIALRFESQVWQQHTLYLRTQSRSLPSERTVRQVLAPEVLQQFVNLPPNSIIAKIQRGFDSLDDNDDTPQRFQA